MIEAHCMQHCMQHCMRAACTCVCRALVRLCVTKHTDERHCAGETTSREYFKGCQLPASRGTLGIATVGDALHKLIPATSAAPCSVKEVHLFACSPAAHGRGFACHKWACADMSWP